MAHTLEHLNIHEVQEFWLIFKQALTESFPGYSAEVRDYFTETVYTPAVYHYWLKQKAKYIIVAKDNDKIMGFAVIDSPYGGVSLCRWLGVLLSHQKQGIGTKLIKLWEELARSDGCHKIEVAAQPQAKAFYEKMGLLQEGFRAKSYFGIDQYLYGRIIGKPDSTVMVSF